MEKQKKTFQMPHTYIIIFLVICVAAIMTLFIPLGTYQQKEITYIQNGEEVTKTVLDPDSFEYVLDENGNKVTKAAPLWGTEDFGGQGILNFVFEGMTVGDKNGTAVGIIAFILVVGGAFGIVLRTGAVDAGIMRVIAITKGREILLIPILITLFSLGGAVFGMGEEAIPFVMILAPMFVAMGYDGIVGILCSYVATQIGFGSSWMNPFSLAVAQGIAGIPVMSGAPLRIVRLQDLPSCLPCAMRLKSRKIRSFLWHMNQTLTTEMNSGWTASRSFPLRWDTSWFCYPFWPR